MKLPKKVNVSGIAYDLVKVQGLAGREAINAGINFNTHTIRYDPDLDVRYGLVHEIVHAVMCQVLGSTDHSEKLVNRITHAVLGFIDSNKKLIGEL